MAGEAQVNQEAVARAALVKEGSRVGAPTNAEVGRHEAAYRAKLARMQGGETAANLSQVIESQGRVTQGNGENALEANIGTQVDKTGKKTRTEPGAKDRLTDAQKAEELGRKLSTEPYNILTPEQQAKVRSQLDEVINVTALSDLDKTARDALFADVIKDPEFLHLLSSEYGSATGKRLGERVTDAQRRLEEAKTRENSAKTKRDRIDRELEGRRKAQELYAAGGDGAKRMGETANSPAKVKTITARIASHQNLINSLNAQIALGRGGSDALTTVQRLQSELEPMETQLASAESEAAEYTTLKEGKVGLPDRISDLESKLEEAEEQYQLASGEKNAAEVDVTTARSERTDAEREWLGQMENLPRTAMARYVEGKIGRANQAAAEALLELEKSATDAQDKNMAKYARTQFWRARKPTFWNKSTVESNRETVMRNIDLITNPKVGPEDIVRHALRTQGLSQAEIDQKMADTAFVNEWATEYSQQLFGSYIRLGGRVTPDMYEYISTQPWGENLIEKAVEANSGIKAKEAELKAAGLLGPGGLAEYIKSKKKTLSAGVLAALLAGVFGGLPGAISAGMAVGAASGGADVAKQAYTQG